MNTLADLINKDYLGYIIGAALAVACYCLWKYNDRNILVPQTGRYIGWGAWWVVVLGLFIYWLIS